MDTNNWRSTHPSGEPAMESGDWKAQMQPDRQTIVNRIIETLKKHLPPSGPERIPELRRIAATFEEKTFTNATNRMDYLRKISMKLMAMSKSQSNAPASSTAISSANNSTPLDSGANGSTNMPSIQNQGQSLPVSLPANQAQGPQQLLSAALPSSLPLASSISNNNISGVLGPNSNVQIVSGMLQASSEGSMGQALLSNVYPGSQSQMTGRPHGVSSQQQQQPQNDQYLYQQQVKQQLLRQNFQQGNLPNALMSSHMQQPQQNGLQPNQLHSSQQHAVPTSVMQPSTVNSAPLSDLHTNQQLSVQQPMQSMLWQHQPSLLRQHQQQASGVHQQQTSLPQSITSLHQQQAQLVRQQASNSSGIQQNQMIGQQNVVGNMQRQQPHPQRLLGQQNSLTSIQQQRPQQQQLSPQQQLMSQQNSIQAMHQQQLATQSNVSGLQQPQQQLLGTQVGNSSMQTNPQSVHMLSQSKVAVEQRIHQTGTGMLASQGQQSQHQPSQQQVRPQLQSDHQQLGLQQSNLPQHDVQQRLQAPGQVTGSLHQSLNIMDQQRQLYQSQGALPEMPSTSLDNIAQTENANRGDWQEEVYQKITSMKNIYLPELNEHYRRFAAKMAPHESLPQSQRPDQYEKLKHFKSGLERLITVLSLSKNNIPPTLKDKIGSYEKTIVSFLEMQRGRQSLKQGQQSSHMLLVHQPPSRTVQGQSHDNQANSQMQPMNVQGSASGMQHNSPMSLQNNSPSPLHGDMVSMPASSLEPGQGNALNTAQQVAMGTTLQNPGSISQQVNNGSASSQGGVNTLQPNVNLAQSNSSVLQHQHLKQRQEQQMTQLHKQQLQHRKIQQQLIQKQQLLHQQQQQQLLQQQQQQQHQLQARQQIAQLHQMNNVNDLTMRQGMNASSGMFQQHPLPGQWSAYPLQQLKPGTQLPVPSPQMVQGASQQIVQHSSPQVDQKNLLSSVNRSGTLSANSPFVVPSPSTPLAPSPVPVDPEKNTGNIAHKQANGVQGFSNPDGNNVNPLATTCSKPSVTEQPVERLVRVMKSISSQALTAAVSDIGSVVSLIDRIAGSAPVSGSRASVGEDLVAMTKCRRQARNFVAQDGTTETKKMKRHIPTGPFDVASSGVSISDDFKQFAGLKISDLESTATSASKRRKTEINHDLVEEIREINWRLIDTVVEVSKEDSDTRAAGAATEGGEGTILRFSFVAVSLSPSLKAHLSSTQMSPLQPLRLLVPPSYPNCSPVLLDKLPVEISKENEDLSTKVGSRFSLSLRSLTQPMSLKDIARTWDACARAVICEYAQQFGGGTFSSKYGTWENFVAAA